MKKYIIAFLLFINTYAYSEIVSKVEVEGNSRVSKETILVYGDISLNSDYETSDLNRILKNLYSTNFFDDIKLTLDNGVLKIIVKEYPIVNNIKVDGEPKKERKKELLERISLKKSSPFIKNIFERVIFFLIKIN